MGRATMKMNAVALLAEERSAPVRQCLRESAPPLLTPGRCFAAIPEFPEEPKFGMKPPCPPDRLLVWGALTLVVHPRAPST